MKDDPTSSMINESEDEDETGAMLIDRTSALSESDDMMAMTTRRSTSLLGVDDDSDQNGLSVSFVLLESIVQAAAVIPIAHI